MKPRWATVGLALFLLVDIVLVYVALRPSPRDASSASSVGRTSAPAASTTADGESSAQPTTGTGSATTSSRPSGTTPTPKPLTVLIVGLDRSSAWRATVGTCKDGGGRLELTTDGGASWHATTAPAAAISRIQPLEAARGFVVASGSDCAPSEYTTTDGGATWSGPKDLAGGWTRRLDITSEVVTPQQPKSRPCGDKAVLDLSRVSADQAEALCVDGSVEVTNDGGQSWGDSGEAQGAVAISNRLEGGTLTTFAARIDPSGTCKGVEVVTVTKGQEPSSVACVEVDRVKPGSVAISAAAKGGWLLIGDQTWTSGPTLTSWKKA